MFSPFGQATQNTSPAFNPFAPKPKAGGSNPFGSDGAGDSAATKQNKRKGRPSEASDNEAKRKGPKPFKERDTDVSDGGRSKGRRGEDRKKNGGDRKKGMPNGDGRAKKLRHQNGSQKKDFSADHTTDASRPTSSSSSSSTDDDAPSFPTASMPNTSDPHARKVYTRLHKDGITPPSWPSQPGDPNNAAAMSRFREKYEKYRAQVRASLTKAGLIDDPNKRRALKDAIEFKGISEDMCPEFEKITRITESDVNQPEKNPKTAHPATTRMVKKLARSAAGQEAPLPMDVRSVPTLRKTLDYLVDDLLKHDGNLPSLHGFLWDRTRAIRRDFAFFSSLTAEELRTQVYVLENIARFHVTSLHLLSRKGNKPEEFVEQQELEQLGKTLLSLRDLYDDCNAQDIVCENEAEYRAYYLIFHAQDPNILETLQRSWKPQLWRDSDEVRTAVSLVEALQNTKDFHGPHGPLKEGPSLAAPGASHFYFRIVEDSSMSYTMACFAECHFPLVRRSILRAVTRALARPKEETRDISAATLNKFLRFDKVEEAIEFAELHGLEFEPDEADPSDARRQLLLLRHRQQLPQPRLKHQFSQTLVEKKRGKKSLPEVIHHTVFEDPNAKSPSGIAEDSLFVSPTETQASENAAAAEPPKANNPFSSFGKPSGGFSSSLTNGVTVATQDSQAKPNPFASASSSTTSTIGSSFASAVNTATDKPAAPSFGAFSQAAPTPAPAAGPFSSFGGQTKGTNESNTKVSETTTKPNPFGSMFQPNPSTDTASTTKGMFASKEEQSSKPLDATPAAAPKESEGAKAKAPAFAFQAPKNQTSLSTGNTSGASPFNFPAIPNPSEPSSGPPKFQFPNNATTSTPSLLPTSTEPTDSTVKDAVSASALTTSKSDGQATSRPAFSLGSSLSTASTVTLAPTTTPAAPISTEPAAPPAPRRDLMGDFTRWFVKGDNGILEDFQAYMVDELIRKVYSEWREEEESRKRKEEEDRINAEVEAFRVYNLRVKFFYRWKRNARAKRLRFLRQSGREQFRAFHAARKEKEREAARKAAEDEVRASKVDRSKEMVDILKRKRGSRRQAEEELLASGILSGVENEREHAARIVRREPNPSSLGPPTNDSSRASSPGSTARKLGGKTQALREKLLQGKTEGFRRSLPSMSTRSTTSPEPSKRVSNVSERWRLKAMGIVQMPDGTALPENLANEILYGGKKYPGLGNRPRASSYSMSRPALPTSEARPESRSLLSRSYGAEDSPPTNKRKRPADDEAEAAEDDPTNPHKRVMSDNQKLISELRAMREELEEGAAWYKSQTEKLQSEVGSRGTTPWDESI